MITVTNGGSGLSAPDYPAPFVANVAAAPGCTTIEGVDVVFPNPGKNVKYGGSYAQSKPTAVAGISGDCANAVGPQPAQPSAPAQSPSPSPAAAPSKASAAAPSSSPSTSTAQAATNGHETLLAGSDIVTSTAKAPQLTSTALSGGHCKKRKRSNGTMARRHERLAAKALKRGGKRIAALPASYNVAAGL